MKKKVSIRKVLSLGLALAMLTGLLSGCGKEEKRTWYTYRSLKRNDWLAIGFAVAILVVDLTVTFWDGSRYYNPFL